MAVKKQTTTRSSVAKTKPAAKKVPAKKPVKKTVRKTPAKKTVTKAPAKKAPTKSSVPRKTPAKKKSTATKQSVKSTAPKQTREESEVTIPKNMSIRAREKSLVLQHEWTKAMYKIAYTSGLCFAVVGGTLALLSVFGNLQSYTQTALVLDLDSATNVSLVPQLQVISDIPNEITSEYKVNFSLNDVSLIKARLFKVGATSGYPELELTRLQNDRYGVTINPASYPRGWYDLVISYTPSNTQYDSPVKKVGTFHLGAFIDGQSEVPPEVIADPNSPTVVAPIDDTPALESFRIFTQNESVSGTVVVGLAAPAQYEVIELYARSLNSLNSQFIGLATERFGQRQFAFDSNSRLANGTYELYAQSKNSAGALVKTQGIRVVVANPISSDSTGSNTGSSAGATRDTNRVPLTSEESAPVRFGGDVLDREFADVDFIRTETTDSATESETVRLLNENMQQIVQLVETYAVARQSGDEMLIQDAQNSIDQMRNAIVYQVMSDERMKDLADNIDERLTEKLQEIENRVDAFEAVRAERTGGDSAVDTDNDGISDFDEINLYQTNPEEPDTDGDGFLDGVEIIRGFNPNSAEAEAVISYESPRESFALVRDEVLSVTTVEPVVTDTEAGPAVQTLITGTGIPNSFATLYIFSSPIVVTVKTDSDGSFVYTLDKELADGEHLSLIHI